MTAFSNENYDRTKRAHLAAQNQFYPNLFPNSERIQFLDTTQTVKDLEHAIDCILAVTPKGNKFRRPLKFLIQERWREIWHQKWKDVTVTEWNTVTDLPSELHKIAAQIFVYGYYDPLKNRIVRALAIDVAVMMRAIAEGKLRFTRENRASRDQDFIGIKWDDLYKVGAVMHSMNMSNNVETLTDLVGNNNFEVQNTLFGPAIVPKKKK